MGKWYSAKIKDMYLFRSQPNTQSIFSFLFSPQSEHFNRNLTPDAPTPLTGHSPAHICILNQIFGIQEYSSPLVAGCTSSAAAADTLHVAIFFQLSPWYSADASAVEVGFLGLNTAQATELSICQYTDIKDERGQNATRQLTFS